MHRHATQSAAPYNKGPANCADLALICTSDGAAKSSGLLVDQSSGIAALASGKERLGFRGVTRVRLHGLAIRGAWTYGLVLRSTHLAEVETVNIAGVGPGRGSAAGLLLTGGGAPTGHTLENLRVFFFGTGAAELRGSLRCAAS